MEGTGIGEGYKIALALWRDTAVFVRSSRVSNHSEEIRSVV